MAGQNQKRNTLLFVGMLVLGGVIHIAANILHNTPIPHYSVNTMLFCLEFVIYTMLLFFWIQSVRIRLLPTRAKTYMLILATQMVAYLSLRAFKYRIAESAVAIRYAWYIFYVPMILIPTLFLMVCIRIARGEKTSAVDERLYAALHHRDAATLYKTFGNHLGHLSETGAHACCHDNCCHIF